MDQLAENQPDDQPTRKTLRPRDLKLMRTRIRELDREFARQTKQLTQLAKKLKNKLGKH